jgi:putative PIG3 family NAD(P)H quinone oxidoreductase
MRCIEIAGPGGPEVLRLTERPDPVPGAGEVLIAVHAAGVNRPDVLQRQGGYPPPAGASDIPGLEVSGRIVQVGDGVSRWHAGDDVCALVAGGGYASLCVAPEAQCLAIPAGLDLLKAAALPETYFTVWSNVFDRGRLQAGETALFHGGTSGIGTTAIQLAASRGVRVFATAGSDEKCRACEGLGAERGINYRTTDFVAEVKDLTNGRGVDLILDIMGGSYVARNLNALAVEGRLVQIGLLESASATIDLWRVMGRRLTITGSTLRARPVVEKGQIAEALQTHVWPLLAQGVARPIVHATLPLAQAAEAHRLMESSAHVGKIVLTVADGV